MTFSAAASSVPQLGWSRRYLSPESESARSCTVVINTPLTQPGSGVLRSTINIIINHAARPGGGTRTAATRSNRALAVPSRTDCWVADWVSDVGRKEDLLLCCSVAVLRKHQADKSAFPGPITRCRVIRDHLDTRLLRRVLHHAAVLQCCRHNLGHVPIIARPTLRPLAG